MAKSAFHFRDGVGLAKRFVNRTFVTDVGEINLEESGMRTFQAIIYRLDDLGVGFEVKIRSSGRVTKAVSDLMRIFPISVYFFS